MEKLEFKIKDQRDICCRMEYLPKFVIRQPFYVTKACLVERVECNFQRSQNYCLCSFSRGWSKSRYTIQRWKRISCTNE
jgi:hypothetical protein